MDQSLTPKIRVVKLQGAGQIASVAPEQFRDPDVEQIANITNQIVVNLQNNLQTSQEAQGPGHLALTEVELAFGIDFGVEAKLDVKVPIIGPIAGGSAHGSATFEVHIKLSRNNA